MTRLWPPRVLMRDLAWRLLIARADAMTQLELAQDAWVVVPHQDDEVLSCGGTIMRKLAAGAHIRVAFVTDGSKSHPHPEGEAALRSERREEAVSACRIMGVPETDLVFLGFPDGELPEHVAEATTALAQVLREHPAGQIFLPFRRDEHPDHVATHAVVAAALDTLDGSTTRWEYGTWLWNHWPWVPLRDGGVRSKLGFVKYSLELFSFLLRNFRCSVEVSQNNQRKRAALEAHRSQMQPRPGSKDWMTLDDFSGGEWLACFFRSHELYCRRRS